MYHFLSGEVVCTIYSINKGKGFLFTSLIKSYQQLNRINGWTALNKLVSFSYMGTSLIIGENRDSCWVWVKVEYLLPMCSISVIRCLLLLCFHLYLLYAYVNSDIFTSTKWWIKGLDVWIIILFILSFSAWLNTCIWRHQHL